MAYTEYCCLIIRIIVYIQIHKTGMNRSKKQFEPKEQLIQMGESMDEDVVKVTVDRIIVLRNLRFKKSPQVAEKSGILLIHLLSKGSIHVND